MSAIQNRGSITIQEIMKEFGVSDMTARRDLYSLAKSRLVERKFGGAVKPAPEDYLFSFDESVCLHRDKKEELCHRAAMEIRENEIIYIDGGSTAFYLAKYLGHLRNIRVITNSLPLVSELKRFQHIDVTLLGGEIDTRRKVVFGLFAEQMIGQLHAHRAFVGTDGITLKNGFSTYYENEARISAKMIDSSDYSYILADASKFEIDAYIIFAPLRKVTSIVTDSTLPDALALKYTAESVSILKKRN
jgi:DeoR family fructose operon transcriptional repressor